MNPLEILIELKKCNVVPGIDGDQLKLSGETGKLSVELIAEIKAGKEELISFLRNSSDKVASSPISTIALQEHYPVSNAQKRLWVLCQFEGGGAAYNIVTSLYLKGKVIKEHFEKAFQLAINRHESLRTVFKEIDGEPRQLIVDHLPFSISYEDISNHKDIGGYLKLETEQSATWNFDLENGPLLRVKLIQFGAQEYAMIFGVHHIISDGWSIGVLIQELMYSYESYCKNEEPVMVPLRIQYKDYTQWSNDKIEEPRMQQAKTFWKKELNADLAPLHLPTDFARPAMKSFEGELVKYTLDKELYSQIEAFCKLNQATLFNFFRATLSILLYKLSGQNEMIIGTPASGRNHYDLENQIGLYVNTIPLKTTLNPDDIFIDFLKKVSANSFRAFEFQDYTLDRIIEDLNVKMDTGRNPLFDVMMVLQNTAMGDGSINFTNQYGFELSLLDSFLQKKDSNEKTWRAVKFDLNFNFGNEPGGEFSLEIEYATKLFSRERIDQFFTIYLNIIKQVVQEKELTISTIEITDASEKRRLLHEFNQPVQPVHASSISEILAQSFLQHSDKTAILINDERISYGALKNKADAAAVYLLPFVNSDSPSFIGLLLDRSEWTIISILAALKTGTAYVPVDIKYPQARINYILEDSQPACLLVDDKGFELVPEGYKGRIIHINELKALPEVKDIDSLIPPLDLRETIAYIIYTSGSTGQPKGVEICHRNTIAFLNWAEEEFKTTLFDIVYATTSYCFDLSIFEFFFPLIAGKSIRLLSSALEIPEFIERDHQVMINTVPAVVRGLLDQGMNWKHVSALNMAGEQVPKKMKQELDFSRIAVRNLYGPSEDTTYSTVYRFQADGHTHIPIGKPAGYTQLYILDNDLNLLPEGVEGEIYLSGQSVAKGYLNKPALTKERFLANPFVPGLIMYKTGDIGKWLADGNVQFSGRADDQVKIRGYRIEPGEIQYLLETYPQLEHAVITVSEIAREYCIVAYWVGADTVTAAALKTYLSLHLPAYMVPEYFVQLAEIPLNSNGKVEKNKLPHPVIAGLKDKVRVAPVNLLQTNLMELWKEVLQVEEAGITDSFFELGGHSLKAARLRYLVLSKLKKNLTLDEIFLYPTIEQQAGIIESKPEVAQVVIQHQEEKPYYPISFSQERLWVLTQFEEASKAYHMPAAFRISGLIDIELLNLSFKMVIERHEILRTIFTEKDGNPVQVVLRPEDVNFSLEEINAPKIVTTQQEAALLQQKWEEPFDLEKGPLLSCFLLHTSNSCILSFNMHHIISDGWSVVVLYKNIIATYQWLLAGHKSNLPTPELQFKDYVLWQRKELDGQNLQQQLDFWKEVFDGDIPVLELPADFHRPEIKSYQGAAHTLQLDQELSKKIISLAKQADISVFTTLLAGVNVLLKKISGQQDIIVGTPVAGREYQELQDQIGFYVNTLAIRTKIDSVSSFQSLLSAQRDILLNAFKYQAFPFEMLVEELQLKRNLSRSPLFDVMVVLQNVEGLNKEEMSEVAPGVTFERLELAGTTAKYDLTFSFAEHSGGLLISLEYNTELFKEETAVRMTKQLVQLFEQVTEDPEILIRDISLLAEEEYNFLNTVADRTATGYDQSATVLSLFKQSVSNFPDKIALVAGNQQISYQELDHRSSQLAHILIHEHQVRPEDLVVLHFSRSAWMIIGILAVMKAGAAYVPVDPAYPVSRIKYIMEDSNSSLVLFDVLPVEEMRHSGSSAVFLDITALDYTGPATQAEVEHHQLLYVIYTSGTTGNPKGVQIEHGNVTRMLFTEKKQFDFTETDRWPLFHSYCFDLSVWEMYGALLTGATLVMVPKEVAQDSVVFYDFLKEEKITILNQTLTSFRSLLQHNKQRFASEPVFVRNLLLGGESLMPEIVRSWYDGIPGCKIFNTYGPTEITVTATYKEITAEEITANKSNIGVPFFTTSCYILDDDRQQVPIGVIGELCIGGAGVARGYLNKLELTAEKFIADPLGKKGRIYRSGDYARFLPSGDIEYIGRRDDQVKIRGYRIELAEVESVIIKIEGVKDAVVLAMMNSEGDYELVSYYIQTDTLPANLLREKLGELLPAYMVPSHLIALPEFPINNSGKLDRNALPKPAVITDRSIAFVEGRNETDRELIAIWEEILGKSNIGIKDNFFDLGGHSLKATRVISRINMIYGVKVDLKTLFIDPTVEHLSNYIDTVRWMENKDEALAGDQDELIF